MNGRRPKMSTSYFYLQATQYDNNDFIIKSAEEYSNKNLTQIYILDSPLGDTRYSYEHKDHLIS